MLGLELVAELAGVTGLTFSDSAQDPYYFTFRVACAACHEEHDRPVKFNGYSEVQLAGSRGEANFTFKCRMCSKENNLSVVNKYSTYGAEDSGKKKVMAQFEARGVVLVDFLPDNTPFTARGEDSGTPFEVEFDDGEWYDYDEKAGAEVSVTNTQWTITKLKS